MNVRITMKNPTDVPKIVNLLEKVSATPDDLLAAQSGDALALKQGSCALKFDFIDRFLAGESTDVQASDLAALITLAPKLYRLELNMIHIVGDFSLVLQALSECKTLQLLGWYDRIRDDAADMVALGETVAKSNWPFVLSIVSGHETATWKILLPVLRANNLKMIGVGGGPPFNPIEKNGFSDYLEAAAQANKLDCLHFGLLGFPYVEAVAALLPNMPWLEKLSVSPDADTSFIPLARALKDHKSMQTLELEFRRNINQEEVKAFLPVFKNHNFVLENLEFEFKDEEFAASPAVIAVLDLIDDIDFYLTLNRLDRAKLLAPGSLASTDEWIKPIANQSDPSVIFYFLSKNPSIICPVHCPLQST